MTKVLGTKVSDDVYDRFAALEVFFMFSDSKEFRVYTFKDDSGEWQVTDQEPEKPVSVLLEQIHDFIDKEL